MLPVELPKTERMTHLGPWRLGRIGNKRGLLPRATIADFGAGHSRRAARKKRVLPETLVAAMSFMLLKRTYPVRPLPGTSGAYRPRSPHMTNSNAQIAKLKQQGRRHQQKKQTHHWLWPCKRAAVGPPGKPRRFRLGRRNVFLFDAGGCGSMTCFGAVFAFCRTRSVATVAISIVAELEITHAQVPQRPSRPVATMGLLKKTHRDQLLAFGLANSMRDFSPTRCTSKGYPFPRPGKLLRSADG